MDIGTTLRTARERHDLSLAQLAARTKIPLPILQALEDNDFDRVPRGIFTRGYLRAYAHEVMLDERGIVGAYVAQHGPTVPAPGTEAVAPGDGIDETFELAPIDPALRASRQGWGSGLVVAALLVAVVAVNRSADPVQGSAVPPARAERVSADAIAVDAASDTAGAVGTGGVADDVETVATAPVVASARFQFEAQAPCWVEAVVDGRKVVYRLMQRGDREAIDPGHEIVLRIGDPGAFTYSVNGAPGAPLGKAGVPVTVRFTSEGERLQLAS